MRLLSRTLLLAALLALAVAARADVSPPRMFGIFSMEVGSWSEYEITQKKTGEISVMRMNVLSKEGNAYWYEVWLNSKDAINTIKMLVTGNPNEAENVQRLILQSGREPPIEMPRDFMVMGRKMAAFMYSEYSGMPTDKDAISKLKMEKVGTRTVQVPAGKFTGDEIRIVDPNGKQWATYVASADIKPFGVIWSDSEGSEMKLKAFGKDARTRVIGDPRKLSGPPRMPQGMPRGMPPGMQPPLARPLPPEGKPAPEAAKPESAPGK